MLTRKSAAAILCAMTVALSITAANATQLKHGQCDNDGRCVSFSSLTEFSTPVRKGKRQKKRFENISGAIVASRSGIRVRVNPSARAALQCVVDHVEAAGVSIKAMRGYGGGTVRGSLHPAGQAIDINQTARDVTRPHVPRHVSNAAADACGVISGARWGYADNGHWNLSKRADAEPWPRTLAAGR